MPFSTLGLSYPLVQAIKKLNYVKPYPIQRQAIPVILQGEDLLGIAKTGSGKTAGYVLPILEMFEQYKPSKNRYVKVLILVPSRELAMQVAEVFQSFLAHLSSKIKVLAVYGGVSANPQMIKLQGTDILVATPGRLLDLVSSNAVKLSEVGTLVLDEADKMLNQGFKEEMDTLFSLLPKNKQTLLFSATLSPEVVLIKELLLYKPTIVHIDDENLNIDLIKQIAYNVENERKGPLLRYLIKSEKMMQVLVFVSSIQRADNVVNKLLINGIDSLAFHSGRSQGARTEALRKFKAKELQVLVATDLASRGLDIQFLPVVINYELPRSPKDYIHRIGRTGRAESPGKAISFICEEDVHHFKVIQKKMQRHVNILESDDLDLQGY